MLETNPKLINSLGRSFRHTSGPLSDRAILEGARVLVI